MDTLSGSVERITYVNPESGWTVARLLAEGARELTTIVGNLVAVSPGEHLELEGDWVDDPRYGRQFRVERFRTTTPSTLDGVRRYLGSGLIHGIGPKMAEKLVNHFGERTLEVIENDPSRLFNVPGFGRTRVESIKQAWVEQREIRNVMIFLQSHGVGAAFAARIFKRYGQNSIQAVQDNPYRLAADIDGIGFLTADRIASRMGISGSAPERIQAGLVHVLGEAAGEGHVFVPRSELLTLAGELLQVDVAPLDAALDELALDARVVIEPRTDDPAVYLRPLHAAECGVAGRLRQLARTPGRLRPFEADKAVGWAEKQLALELTPRQREAVSAAVTRKLVVITGGPGTGKSTIIRAVLEILTALKANVAMAAPTGRAAKRMGELTGRNAKTIHRLLEFSPADGGFQRSQDRPLKADVVIIDEASMIDTALMNHLTRAVADAASLVLVGDVDQLPSVGPGTVLRDLIASGLPHVVRLDQIFRQAEGSWIITNAHRINHGEFPGFPEKDQHGDFFLVRREDPDEVRETIVDLCRRRLPHRFGLDAIGDIQVLCPMHRGPVGTQRLNADLQEALNRSPIALTRGSQTFRLHDKVIQIVNDYDKDVFNGDIGRVVRVDAENGRLAVEFDDRKAWYEAGEIEEIMPAYAISIHKAQGSEYPAVVIPMTTSHYIMLQRNLLYTAVTRGRRLVVLVGSAKAIGIALRNDKPVARWSLLAERLSGARRS